MSIVRDSFDAFTALIQASGDFGAAAQSLGIDPAALHDLAREGGWEAELARLAGGRDCRTPEDYIRAQRSFNRGINFIQSHRLRELVDVFLVRAATDPAYLVELTTIETPGKHGPTIRRDLRPLKDLADAVRTAHDLSYRALGDSTAQTVIDERELARGGRNLQLDLMRAMDAHDANPGVGTVALARSGAAGPSPATLSIPGGPDSPEPVQAPALPVPGSPLRRPVGRPRRVS